MLWFKCFLGSNFFKPVFSLVSDYDNEYKTKRNTNQTSLKKFKPRKNLNHNICLNYYLKILNPFTPKSDQYVNSLCNFNTLKQTGNEN